MTGDSKTCGHYYEDGCGNYCKAIDMKQLKESGRIDDNYPHKYWRVDCYNERDLCMHKVLYHVKKEITDRN